MAYHWVSLIDLYLHTKCHSNWKKNFVDVWTYIETGFIRSTWRSRPVKTGWLNKTSKSDNAVREFFKQYKAMNCYREKCYLGDKSAMSRSSLCVKSSMLVSLVSDMRDSEHADTCRLRSNNWHGVQRSVGDTATHSSSSPRQRVNAPICQSHHSMMHYNHHGVSSVTLLSPCTQRRLLVTLYCQWQPGKMPTIDTPTSEKINMFASTSILPHFRTFQTIMTFTLTLDQLIQRYIPLCITHQPLPKYQL